MSRPRSRTLAVIRKELTHILRDGRSLGIALMMPVVMLVMYGYGISSDIKEIRLGVVDQSHSAESRRLLDAFTQSGYFVQVASSDRYGDMETALESRQVLAALIIPPDYAKRIARGEPAPVQALLDGSDPNTASVAGGYMDSIVRQQSTRIQLQTAQRRGMGARPRGFPPLDPRIRVWYNEELRGVNYIVPGLIAVVLMATSALLTSGTISRERERGTIEQLVVCPVRPRELMVGKIAAYTLLGAVDVLLVVLVGTLWFGVPLRGSLCLLSISSLIFIMNALGLGLLISSAIPSQQAAMLAAILATQVPSVLLSGFYFPIASMPRVVQLITYVIPARYFMVITRGIFLKGIGLEELWPQLLPMTALGALFLTGSVLAFRKRI